MKGLAAQGESARTAELPSTPSSVTTARHLLRDDLFERGVPNRVIDDALVVVTELMGNAVRHGGLLPMDGVPGSVRVRWTASQSHVAIDVTDGGGGDRPHVSPASVIDTGGRGLAIVSAVASDWGVRTSNGQVTVYAVVGGA
jgi:anti-sigma regulatory factor (Ser/Thr protein kinase)